MQTATSGWPFFVYLDALASESIRHDSLFLIFECLICLLHSPTIICIESVSTLDCFG
jgi:hypothetical protein